ncbi:hypothetical protein [Niveibacterium sp.]|uniref:hypothetical protein n=1 Tax=Niveibacterium sp. TaxID=2017444 RepID=UPI0035AE61EA
MRAFLSRLLSAGSQPVSATDRADLTAPRDETPPLNGTTQRYIAPIHLCHPGYDRASAFRVFFDTEFTQLRDGQLLSIGAVAQDGKEFYCEIRSAALEAASNPFVRKHVLPQFGRVPGASAPNLADLGTRLGDWLEALPASPVILCYDYKTDWRLLEDALQWAGVWPRVSAKLRADDIADDAAHPVCRARRAQTAAEMENTSELKLHHALFDARLLRAAFEALPWASPEREAEICKQLGWDRARTMSPKDYLAVTDVSALLARLPTVRWRDRHLAWWLDQAASLVAAPNQNTPNCDT